MGYQKLALYEKRLCWYYYKAVRTNGDEGFDPDKNTHKAYWQASGTVKSYIKWREFRYRALKVIPIAKELVDEGIEIEEPDLPENSASTQKEEVDEEQKGDDSDSYEDESDEEEVTDEDSTPEPSAFPNPNLTPIRSPTKMSGKQSSAKKKRPSVKHPKSTERLCVNGIPSPLCMGSFTKIHRTTRRLQAFYQIRILYHNFLDKNRIWHKWQPGGRQLEVIIYDPPFWSNPEYQAAFDHDHDGESQLIASMIENQEERKEPFKGDPNNMVTANKGIFVFDEDMSSEDGDTILSVEEINHTAFKAKYLKIKCKADPKIENVQDTYSEAVSGMGAVNIGTGKQFVNVRSREDGQTMIEGTQFDTDNRVDPDLTGKRMKTLSTHPHSHGSSRIPPTPITSLIQQGGDDTRPMETVEGIDGWDDESMLGPSYGTTDVFSPIEFTGRGEVSQVEVVDDNKDLPPNY